MHRSLNLESRIYTFRFCISYCTVRGASSFYDTFPVVATSDTGAFGNGRTAGQDRILAFTGKESGKLPEVELQRITQHGLPSGPLVYELNRREKLAIITSGIRKYST
jgi:hypothetical protein